MEFSLAYSPCPNDTFLFYHLAHGKATDDFQVKEELHDVEELNRAALAAKYQATKLSFAAYFSVMDRYSILDSGSALGRNCGPLLVFKKGNNPGNPKGKKILIPGELTTANLLLKLFLKNDFQPTAIRYDKIIPQLLSGEADFGVLIHEERFTYEKQGLAKFQDLGEWWEETTGKHIPLGAIAFRRDLEKEWKENFDSSLKHSLDLAYKNREATYEYILKHSQDTTREVVDAHIGLYVNEFTRSLGTEGRDAILTLYQKGVEAGFLPAGKEKNLF
ncbi:1,4-dihydroxy-6-naphthoate synthase [Leptospira kmetyi]|uniref:1,4-dihydroxy-6-naphtoate synthase n=1 Tax=Leptospira kmetyi TaxID=408139 RepID=A0ABX4N689_9LEPT|nr:1,4-dihydroxy-6-naphthoate synthase [Leptospira kmetyi]EQA55597.1 menaquinone biosynthesis protein [Leptospira kmetyi serovar Malaysia str. Bejo-Iso9]PJZ28903.1 menaquinone biosynthesis protein [Leptospira kmetyi]PJZ39920.1 menaquinone biosynthesis protein [Leptospira kmetyi]TGK15024.1 menaquinone biosynthesis protein [Leptospira kmetyi]TGK31417.1 menaquinone biosynthesis protein [Leptospira kmetyi]